MGLCDCRGARGGSADLMTLPGTACSTRKNYAFGLGRKADDGCT